MRGNYQTLLHNLYLQLWINTIEMFFKVKAVSDDTIFACGRNRGQSRDFFTRFHHTKLCLVPFKSDQQHF